MEGGPEVTLFGYIAWSTHGNAQVREPGPAERCMVACTLINIYKYTWNMLTKDHSPKNRAQYYTTSTRYTISSIEAQTLGIGFDVSHHNYQSEGGSFPNLISLFSTVV
jgi:hypothetical protein